jgi:integrase
MITLRYKPLKSGNYSLYFDIYSSDSNGFKKRQYEFLNLQVAKDYSKIKNILTSDRDTMLLVEDIRSKRELELVGEIRGVKPRQRATHKSLIDYLDEMYYKNHDGGLQTLIFHLKNFTCGSPVLFSDVTADWLAEFNDYLITHVSQNGSYGYLKTLKARLNDAFREDLITRNPFEKFKLPTLQEPERITLDSEEVKTLVKTPFESHPHLRWAFLYSCFTGLRISDLKELRWDNIIEEQTEVGTIEYIMQIRPVKNQKESGKLLRVPLTGSACKVLEELKMETNLSGKIFEKLPSERNGRNLLKLWSAKAGLKKDIHFHVGRHTFATICLTSGIDIYTVSKLLGHTDISTTEIYAKIIDEKKRKEILKLPVL